jgi:putative transposase
MSIATRKGSHSVFSVRLHFVFVTRYRRKAINAAMLIRMHEMFSQVCKKMDCELIAFDGEVDHVHLLVDFHPRNSISAVVSSLKACTSRAMQKEFADHLSKFYRKPVFWSGSYYVASSGGAPIEVLKKYIANQDSPK